MHVWITAHSNRRSVALRITACIMAVILVSCFQLSPLCYAYAANSKSTDTPKTASPNKNNTSLLAPYNAASDDEEEEEDAQEQDAEEKRATADLIYAQAKVAKASLADAKEEYDDAASALKEAKGHLAAAEKEYEEKSVEIDALEEDLSDYVVDMYKQGGTTPYLDVMLRATSYKEFLTSWNMANAVSQYGQDLVVEKKKLREKVETLVKTCNAKVEEAEKAKLLADSKRRQVEATYLALTVQTAQLNLEAAKIDGTSREIRSAQKTYDNAEKALNKALKSGLAGKSLLSGTGYFTHPCPNSTVSSGFGYRSFDNAAHQGIDYAAPEGTPYYAADSGIVTAATNGGGYNGGAGNWVVIDHGNGVVTKYMHSLVTLVSPGDRVERGQNIGLVGTTGQSTGPHLHFQVEMGGIAVNPSNLL